MVIMVFEPVKPEVRAKVISAYLASHGRNKIDRLLHEQGEKVSHWSISNIIARYKREHQPTPQPQSIQQIAATSPNPPSVTTPSGHANTQGQSHNTGIVQPNWATVFPKMCGVQPNYNKFLRKNVVIY